MKQLIKYILLYMVNDCNGVTLNTGRYKREFCPDHERLSKTAGPEPSGYC